MGDQRTTWGVVGGGLLGMTIALRLAQRGKRVTIVEGAGQLGGLAASWVERGVIWDRFYHVILKSDHNLLDLLEELQIRNLVEWRRTRSACYLRSELHSVSNVLDYLRFPGLDAMGKLRLALGIHRASRVREWEPLESILVEDWLVSLCGRQTFERLWLPLLRSKLGDNYRRTSAVFIWATIQRLYAARRSGMKTDVFGYVPGGYARVVEHLLEVLRGHGVDVCVGCRVNKIEEENDVVSVTIHEGARLEFDNVVVTAPSPVAADICGGLTAEEYTRLRSTFYQGVICLSMLVKEPLEGFYLTYLADHGLPFTAVIEMTAVVDPRHLAGYRLVYVPKYVGSEDPMFAVADEEIRARFMRGIADIYPRFSHDDVVTWRVARARRVLAIPTLGYSKTVPPINSSVPGIMIVNSSQIIDGTLNVNETLRLAERAVRCMGDGRRAAA